MPTQRRPNGAEVDRLKTCTNDLVRIPTMRGISGGTEARRRLRAASRRSDFPTATERMLRSVATNQATLCAEEAWLLGDYKQTAEVLDRMLRRRTMEQQATNRELGRALKQIHELKEKLQRENAGLRSEVGVTRGGLAAWQLRRAKELMQSSLQRQVPLSQLAEECGLSVRHFARAFRRSTGLPPHRWLLNLRVEQAQRLLCNPDLPLAEVALACGFADQSHFTRVFTAIVHLSPGLWRRTQPVGAAGRLRVVPPAPLAQAADLDGGRELSSAAA